MLHLGFGSWPAARGLRTATAVKPEGVAPWLWLEKAPPSVDSRRMPSRTPRAAEPNSEKELRRLDLLPASLTGGDGGGGGSECRHWCSACSSERNTTPCWYMLFWWRRVHEVWTGLRLCSPRCKHVCTCRLR